MKKILVIHNSYRSVGGEDTSVKNEIEFLKKYYITETIFFQNKIPNYFLQLFNFLTVTNKKSKKIISEKLDEFKPDLVYVHNTWFNASVSFFDELENRNIKTIVKLHNFRYYCSRYFLQSKHIYNKKFCLACGMEFKKTRFLNKYFEDSTIKSIFLILFSKKFIKKLNNRNVSIFVLTNFHKKFLESLNITKNEVIVFPNYINIPEFKQKNLTTNEQNFILYAGRLSKEKGLYDLIEAFNKSNLNNVKLKIYGEGPLDLNYELTSLNKDIELLGVASNEEIIELIVNSLAVVTATKLYEGQPTLLCEAVAQNTVCIFPRTGGIEEFFPNENLFSFEQFNYDDLVKKLELLKNKKLVNQQVIINKKFLIEKLNEETLINNINKFILDE